MKHKARKKEFDPGEKRQLLATLCGRLFWIQAASMGALVLALFAPGRELGQWIVMLLNIPAACILYKLTDVSGRYRKAALFYGVLLIIGMLYQWQGGGALSAAMSLCAIGETYQEFYAHAETVLYYDRELAEKWERLLLWKLVAKLIVSLVSIAGAVISISRGNHIGRMADWLIPTGFGVDIFIQLLYLQNLKHLQALFTEKAQAL